MSTLKRSRRLAPLPHLCSVVRVNERDDFAAAEIYAIRTPASGKSSATLGLFRRAVMHAYSSPALFRRFSTFFLVSSFARWREGHGVCDFERHRRTRADVYSGTQGAKNFRRRSFSRSHTDRVLSPYPFHSFFFRLRPTRRADDTRDCTE